MLSVHVKYIWIEQSKRKPTGKRIEIKKNEKKKEERERKRKRKAREGEEGKRVM